MWNPYKIFVNWWHSQGYSKEMKGPILDFIGKIIVALIAFAGVIAGALIYVSNGKNKELKNVPIEEKAKVEPTVNGQNSPSIVNSPGATIYNAGRDINKTEVHDHYINVLPDKEFLDQRALYRYGDKIGKVIGFKANETDMSFTISKIEFDRPVDWNITSGSYKYKNYLITINYVNTLVSIMPPSASGIKGKILDISKKAP